MSHYIYSLYLLSVSLPQDCELPEGRDPSCFIYSNPTATSLGFHMVDPQYIALKVRIYPDKLQGLPSDQHPLGL